MRFVWLVVLVACASGSDAQNETIETSPTAAAPVAREQARESPPSDETTTVSAMGAADGEVTVDVNGGWGEVWLDGERVTDETPLNAWAASRGTHRVRVVNPESGAVLVDTQVEVRSEVMTILHVNAAARSHRVEYLEQ
ncbi:MAG: hypothetical protein JRH11_24800 [Deltaproteobacteria bacterium]|nr:hypothetical protein [Deltaproteobacteria bacterium]